MVVAVLIILIGGVVVKGMLEDKKEETRRLKAEIRRLDSQVSWLKREVRELQSRTAVREPVASSDRVEPLRQPWRPLIRTIQPREEPIDWSKVLPARPEDEIERRVQERAEEMFDDGDY